MNKTLAGLLVAGALTLSACTYAREEPYNPKTILDTHRSGKDGQNENVVLEGKVNVVKQNSFDSGQAWYPRHAYN